MKIAEAQWNRALARIAEAEAKVRSDELKIADAKIGLAATDVDLAKIMLAKTILLAPADGIVLRIDAEPGEMLGSESSRPAITFVDDSVIQVRAHVEELDALGLRIGQKSYVTADGLPNKRFAGKITWIAPSMHHKNVRHNKPGERVDVKVREVLIRIDDPKQLVIGLPVEVFIEPSSKVPVKHSERETESGVRPKRPLASTGHSHPLPIREGR